MTIWRVLDKLIAKQLWAFRSGRLEESQKGLSLLPSGCLWKLKTKCTLSVILYGKLTRKLAMRFLAWIYLVRRLNPTFLSEITVVRFSSRYSGLAKRSLSLPWALRLLPALSPRQLKQALLFFALEAVSICCFFFFFSLRAQKRLLNWSPLALWRSPPLGRADRWKQAKSHRWWSHADLKHLLGEMFWNFQDGEVRVPKRSP